MFYDRYKELCENAGKSMSRVALDIGFEKSTITKWKQKGFTPRAELLNKIAEYFNVSPEYLLTGKKNTATQEDDGKTAEFIQLYSQLDEKQKQIVVSLMKSFLEAL